MTNIGPISPKKKQAAKKVVMQYTMQVFHYEEDETDFRVFDKNGEPWFVLSDVARKIGVKNASDLASRLDADEKGVATIDTPGGRQRVRIINETGFRWLVPGCWQRAVYGDDAECQCPKPEPKKKTCPTCGQELR